MAIPVSWANRLGFAVLGLTNNFAYVIMLSAAYDLLNQSSHIDPQQQTTMIENSQNFTPNALLSQTSQAANNGTIQEPYCNAHSTSTILLADTLPSLTTKLIYPFMLVGIPMAYKAVAVAIFSAASFIITGLTTSQVLIFTGVVCASLSSGLGESCYLSMTPSYGDVSLSGWSMGTGAAGLVGAAAYAILRMIFPIDVIMIIMLIVPIAMMAAFFYIIEPVPEPRNQTNVIGDEPSNEANLCVLSTASEEEQQQPIEDLEKVRNYGVGERQSTNNEDRCSDKHLVGFKAKILYLPSLAKYFLPLLLVYFAEYFINQGLLELVYYPEITYLNHAAQYRWFQVTYQLGVMISRSSLDLFRIKNLWAMSLLQAANAILFLVHASKLIHIPSFYLVIAIIVYEGLLGGFTYVNTFYRVKKEVSRERQEFCISTVTVADSLGIVMAGLTALPVHDSLCKLYA